MALEVKASELDLDSPVPIEAVYQREVAEIGNGAHIMCQREHLEKEVIVLVLEDSDG
jgi:putative transposon-encoded protein